MLNGSANVMHSITLTEADLLELRTIIQEFRHRDAVALINYIQHKEQRALRQMSDARLAEIKADEAARAA